MKKSFLQKFISQKIILTMFVGLLLGGCSLDIRKPFYIGDPVKKTFIEYFTDGQEYTYNGVTYTYYDEVFTHADKDTEYTYNDDAGSSMIGTFANNGGVGAVTAEIISGVPVITDIPYLDYFVDGREYGLIYTYREAERALVSYNAVKYTYDSSTGNGTPTGSFVSGGDTVTATVTDGIITISGAPYLDYFAEGEKYSVDDGESYTYNSSDRTLTSDRSGIVYTYNNDAKDMVGTFGSDKELTATVDTTTAIITVRAKSFLEYLADKSAGSVYELTYKYTTFTGYEELVSYNYLYDGSKTLFIGDTKYTYIDDSTKVEKDQSLNCEPSDKDYLVGNFDGPKEYIDGVADYYVKSRVQVMIDLESGAVRVIKPREVEDYFVNLKEYCNGAYRGSKSSDGTVTMLRDAATSIYLNYYYGIFIENGGVGKGGFATGRDSVYAEVDLLGNIKITK